MSTQSKSRHVLLIGIDGVQLEKLEELLPVLSSDGFSCFNLIKGFTGGHTNTLSRQRTMSGPGWTSILTGVWEYKHQVHTNSIDQTLMPKWPSLFTLLNNCEVEDGKFAAQPNLYSICSWPVINIQLVIYPPVVKEASTGNDHWVTERVIQLLNQETDPVDFMFVHLDDIDETGHKNGFGPLYDQAIKEVDLLLAKILGAVRTRSKKRQHEEWMIMLVTDHGRRYPKGYTHGFQSRAEKTTFYGLWFCNVPESSKYIEIVEKKKEK